MRKDKAIKILKTQSEKLNDVNNLDNLWSIETRTYIEKFFGQDSEQLKYVKEFKWRPSVSSEPVLYRPTMVKFLNNCIETISNIGVYKPPTENWFSKLPNWSINLGLPALCFVSFGIGVLFTTNNNYELRKENSELKEKLSFISSDTITNQHKNLSDKPKQK